MPKISENMLYDIHDILDECHQKLKQGKKFGWHAFVAMYMPHRIFNVKKTKEKTNNRRKQICNGIIPDGNTMWRSEKLLAMTGSICVCVGGKRTISEKERKREEKKLNIKRCCQWWTSKKTVWKPKHIGLMFPNRVVCYKKRNGGVEVVSKMSK